MWSYGVRPINLVRGVIHLSGRSPLDHVVFNNTAEAGAAARGRGVPATRAR